MGIGGVLQSIAELLGSGQGSLVLGIAAVIAIGAPFADRYVIRRRRIQFRVLYNSKIGLSPIDLHDESEPSVNADGELRKVARVLATMSVVVIRVRNTGSFDIEPEDFSPPISFTFGNRVIWDARISDASDKDLRELLRDKMEFFTTEPAVEERPARLTGVRALLPRRFGTALGAVPSTPDEAPPLHGVRLTGLALKRNEKFKLVVVLREPNGDDGEITKDVVRRGRLKAGRIKDEKQQRRITWPVVTVAIGVLLTGALIATLLVSQGRHQDPSIQCASGSLRVEGSSAFAPIIGNIAAEYTRSCAGADISTRATGSIDGVRSLAALPGQDKEKLAVLSDGKAVEAEPELVPQAVAVIVYGSVVNRAAGVDRLGAGQLKDIYAGRIRDWNQIRGGPSLPISIVGRGQESGTRQTFERKVLGAPEGTLSSDTCEKPERDPAARTTRCERSSTAQVIDEVAATPGAIGYADAPALKAATARGAALTVVQLDGRYPDPSSVPQGYPFWTVEYLYTKGVPGNESVVKKFVDYLRNGTARAELQDAGYTPCVAKDGLLHPLCVAEN